MRKINISSEQIIKILKTLIIATSIVILGEIIFAIPDVNIFFENIIKNSDKTYVWIILWLLMFLQVTVLPIPAYVILSACVSIGINTIGWEFILITISAYMCGCLLAYWLGWKFGKRAVKWCAGSEEDYNKWCDVLNKKGKFWYLLTVLFPFFPDDMICIVCGSVRFNFWFYLFANLIGRTIGLITMLYTLLLIGKIGGGFPFMIIVWAVALVVELIAYLVLRKKAKKI